MNLATARATNRSKEIGVRKASGAFQSHLIYQFLTESMVVTTISFLLAVLLVNVLLPAFNTFTNKELSLGIHTDYRIWRLACWRLSSRVYCPEVIQLFYCPDSVRFCF